MIELFISDCGPNGKPIYQICPKCDLEGAGHLIRQHITHCQGLRKGKHTKHLDKDIQKLQNRLYYLTHKKELNQKRKKYKRQSWNERMDNPANKRGKV
jgi:DnaJ-class molecular chaperone